MPRQKKAGPDHRLRLEILESRDMMAADFGFTINSLLASKYTVGPTAPATIVTPSTPANNQTTTPTQPANNTSTTAATDWYTTNLHDVALRSVVVADALDGNLSRADMLGIFAEVEKDGVVNTNEYNDLKQIIVHTTLFLTDGYVNLLGEDVVWGNAANANYQGAALGNLHANSSATQLSELVGKWFLGTDHPAVASGITYVQAPGSLFPHAPAYTDIQQGMIGDCYLLSSLAETALLDPSAITNMFIANGDGTYTVQFHNNGQLDFVTVDSKVPVDRNGNYAYANQGFNVANHNAPLWVALAEKAYAEMNEAGWMRSASMGGGQNSYAAIASGYMFQALAQITGQSATYSAMSASTFVGEYNSGKLITFASVASPADGVVGGHAYAVVSYNPANQTVTLFNPWGINNGAAPGLVTLNWTQIQHDFLAMEFTT